MTPSACPLSVQIDGDWRFDSKRGAMVWTIDLIDDTNRTGSMEFVVSAADAEAFYPVEVSHSLSSACLSPLALAHPLGSGCGSGYRSAYRSDPAPSPLLSGVLH